MDEWIRRIGRAKASLDNGFSRVGPGLGGSDRVEGALLGAAGRLASLSNAAVLLCKHHHADDAAPLVRSLVTSALAMRWIVSESRGRPWGEIAGMLETLEPARFWADEAWADRMSRAGLGAGELSSLRGALSELDRSHWRAPRGGLPWAHVFSSGSVPGPGAERVLGLIVLAMGHALRALDERWPGAFQWSDRESA